MILDQLTHAEQYRNLSPGFAAGLDYLRSQDFGHVPDGRYEIIGSDGYAIVQSYTTKPAEKGRWEAHRNYADIQYLFLGHERMGVAPIERMTTQQAYDPEKDLEFFTGQGQFVLVEQGSFAIFLPQDVHMPTIAVDRPEKVKKVVVKVRL